jgi:hypothetical protein
MLSSAERQAIAARDDTITALQAHPQPRLGEPKSDWRPCPFLAADKACSIYEARPLSCHGFVSFDLQACIDFFAARSDEASFMPKDREQVMVVCRMMLCAAHLLTGHGEQRGYELTSAVAAILTIPDAEARWHRGENVLQDVAVGPPIPPGFAEEIRRMAAFVAPTL